MAETPLTFESADRPGRSVTVPPDPDTAVTPGDRPDTARVSPPNGPPVTVAGDYRQVAAEVQAAVAVAHEQGDDRPDIDGGDGATVRELADTVMAGRRRWTGTEVTATSELGPDARAAVRRVVADRGYTGPDADRLAVEVEARVVGLVQGLADDQPATGAD